MDGKAFAWKSVTDSALTAELGRPFQRGITSVKKENWYALVRAKICLNLWGWLERLLLWAKVTDAGNVKWAQLCTALYIMVAAFRCRRTSRVYITFSPTLLRVYHHFSLFEVIYRNIFVFNFLLAWDTRASNEPIFTHFTLSQLFYTKEHARDNSTWRPARKMNLVSDFATISPIHFTPVTVKW